MKSKSKTIYIRVRQIGRGAFFVVAFVVIFQYFVPMYHHSRRVESVDPVRGIAIAIAAVLSIVVSMIWYRGLHTPTDVFDTILVVSALLAHVVIGFAMFFVLDAFRICIPRLFKKRA